MATPKPKNNKTAVPAAERALTGTLQRAEPATFVTGDAQSADRRQIPSLIEQMGKEVDSLETVTARLIERLSPVLPARHEGAMTLEVNMGKSSSPAQTSGSYIAVQLEAGLERITRLHQTLERVSAALQI